MRLLSYIILFIANSCNDAKRDKQPAPLDAKAALLKSEQPGLILQPFGQVDPDLISFIQLHIPAELKIQIKVVQAIQLPIEAFYAVRGRYIADTLLRYLNQFSTTQYPYVMGITANDIETTKGENLHWGVMGLGLQPGNAAIVSVYRIKKSKQTQSALAQRLLKVVVHELGHNFGLPHCSNQHCIMVDAEGKDKLDGEQGFCKNCREFLVNRGFL